MTDPALSVVHMFDLEQGTRWQFGGDSRHRLSRPAYIAVDAEDRIYVTDLRQPAVLVFERNGRFLRAIGGGLLRMPTGLCVDSRNQKLYVADWWRSQVLLFDMHGTLLEVIGSLGGGPGQLKGPGDIVLHDGTLIVLDSINSRFESFDLQGNFLASWPFGPNRTPIAFAFDGEGNLFYIDSDSGGLIAVDPRGQVLAKLGQLRSFGQWAPQVHGTSFTGITADAMGNILALRPTLNIETVRLVSPTAGKTP